MTTTEKKKFQNKKIGKNSSYLSIIIKSLTMVFLTRKVKSQDKEQKISLYMISGEEEIMIDLYAYYFKHSERITKVSPPPNPKTDNSLPPFTHKMISPITLFAKGSSIISLDDRDNPKKLAKEWKYSIEKVGNLFWTESYKYFPPNVKEKNDLNAKMKLTELRYNMSISGDDSFTEQSGIIIEDYVCTNKMPYDYQYSVSSNRGLLQKISYNFHYGYYKICLVIPEYGDQEYQKILKDDNDFIYFGIDVMENEAFQGKTIPKPEFLMVKVEEELRKKLNQKNFQEEYPLKIIFLDYYDNLYSDMVYFFEGLNSIYYRNFESRIQKLSGSEIKFDHKHLIKSVEFKIEKFFIISGTYITKKEKERKFFYIYHVKNKTMNNKEHFLTPLRKCINDNDLRPYQKQKCFTFGSIDKDLEYVNDFRLPGDLSFIIELKTKNRGVSSLNVIKWNEKSQKFENFESVEGLENDFEIYERYDSQDYFISLVTPKVTPKGVKDYHTFIINPLSYNSENYKFDDDNLKLYFKKDKNKKSDTLLYYNFDSSNNILFRRGSETLTIYSFSKPKLLIQKTKNVEYYETIEEKKSSHECKKPYIYTLDVINADFKKVLLNICYAPGLEIGSYFKNTNTILNPIVMRKTFPTGYILRQNINDYTMGSFIELENTQNSKDTKFTKANVDHLMTRAYEVEFNYWEMDGIYAFKMNGELEEVLSVVISLKEDNYIYRGSYHPEGKELGKLERDEFKDFRKIEGVLSMENNLGFFQINDLSYSLELSDKNSKLAPWNGINGVCSKFVKIKHRKIGNLVLCYFNGKFFIKFFDGDAKETRTKEASVDESVRDILTKENLQIYDMKSGDELAHHILLIYWDKGLNGDQNHLRGLIVELYGDLHPIILFTNDFRFNFGEENNNQNNPYTSSDIIDVQIAGDLIIFTISKYAREAFRIFRIKDDFSINFVRQSWIPHNKVVIVRPVQIVLGLSNGETSENYEPSNLEKEISQYFVGCLVWVTREDGSTKGISRKKEILIMKPDFPAVSSMKLIPIPEDFELISFGPLYSESSLNKNIQFILLCKKKKKSEEDRDILRLFLTKQIDSVITFKTEFNMKDIVNSTLDDIYDNEKYNSHKKDTIDRLFHSTNDRLLQNFKESKIEKKIDFSFTIQSQIFSKSEEQLIKSNMDYDQSGYKKHYIEDVKEIKKEMIFYDWFEPFNSKNSNSPASKKINYNEFDYQMTHTKNDWNYKLYLDNNKTYTRGMESTRYIKLDPHDFAVGNVIDSFGYCNSILEKELELVIIPNMTDVDRVNELTCYKPMKDIKVSIFTWCNIEKFEDQNRIDFGCSGKSEMSSSDMKIARTLNELDEHRINSRVYIASQYNFDYFRTTEKNCTKINEKNYSPTIQASADYFYDRKTFRIERIKSEDNATLRIMDMPKINEVNLDKSGKEHWNYPTFTCNIPMFEINPKFVQLRVDKLINEEIDDYILIAFELNPKTGAHLSTLMYRIHFSAKNKFCQVSEPLYNVNKVSLNIETIVYHEKLEKTLCYVFMSLEWINNYKLRLRLSTIKVKKYNETTIEKTETKDKTKIIEKDTFTLVLGNFFNVDLNFAVNPVIITPEQQDLKYYKNPNSKNGENYLIFIVSFPKSNDFLIRIPHDFYKINYKKTQGSWNEDKIMVYEVAAISNPFIGFSPNKDSPNSMIQGDMFYHVRNYDSFSYLMVYKLNFSEFKKISIIKTPKSEKDPNEFKDVPTYLNIMAVKEGSAIPYYKNYIHTKAVLQLKKRAVAATVFTNLYGNNSLFENLLIYSDAMGNIITKKFSSKINIMLKTENVASSKILVWIRGPKTWFTKVVFNILGTASKGFTGELMDWTKILIVVGLSLFAACQLRLFVLISMKITNKRIVTRKRRSSILKIHQIFGSMVKQHSEYKDHELFNYAIKEEDEHYEEGDSDDAVGNMQDYLESEEEESPGLGKDGFFLKKDKQIYSGEHTDENEGDENEPRERGKG